MTARVPRRMADPRIDLLLEILDQAFDRKGWHGTTLRGALRGMTAEAALWRPAPGRHNIWELAVHAAYWKYVVRRRLVTPVGLRSLAPGSTDYREKYYGDLRARDAAYHQGTVWAWLVGPWIDAWIKVHPGQRREARRFLDGLLAHLDDYGVGSLAEIFDAEHPYTPRGCIAQAWSVAEVLRCYVRTDEKAMG